MKHFIIAIGCDSYEHISDLHGAENDARKIFSLLTSPTYGFCDPELSSLVLSPSLGDLQAELLQLSTWVSPGDVVTFYFAGHGYAKGGIFYLCCRDTRPERAGVTALPLSTLLSLIQDLDLSHANVVIDACNSGGVMGDFNRALSSDTIGDAATVGITLLAACAKDQFACEVNGEGLCTAITARCITGHTFVQDFDPALDLTSISAVVAHAFKGTSQQPTFWGLNLTGRPTFCVNPHFSGDGGLRRTLAEAKPTVLPQTVAASLQRLHGEIEHDWLPLKLQNALESVRKTGVDAASRVSFLHSLSQALQQRAAQTSDPFREIEVAATCLSPLLEYCATDQSIEMYLVARCEDLAQRVLEICSSILDRITQDRFELLGETGLAELYLLPVRITNLLGWLSWAILVLGSSRGDNLAAKEIGKQMLTSVLSDYAGSIKSVADVQAPGLLVAVAALRDKESIDELEQLLGLYFADLCESRGLVARVDLEPSRIIDFLLVKAGQTEDVAETAANPSGLLCTLLVAGATLQLDEAFDTAFADLDHSNLFAFIPETYSHFARDHIEAGFNATFRVGDGIWCLSDFRSEWERLPRPRPESVGISLLSTACSLIFPDRVAWHLLDDMVV